MITGQQLRDARSRAGWTQQELADRAGTTLRSVGNWERSKVPPSREGMLRDILGEHLDGPASNPLAGFSDVALLAEVGRRMARGGQQDAGTAEAQKRPSGGGGLTVVPDVDDIAARTEGQSEGERQAEQASRRGEESQDDDSFEPS